MKRAWRATRWVGLIAAGLLLGWKLLAEIIEPHFLLWLVPRKPYVEAQSVEGTTLRLYSDTRPYVGKIAGLQKGLVWIHEGRRLIEEGYGFGCPIIEFQGRAYNSRRAQVERETVGDATRLIKRFEIDTLDTSIRLLRRKYRAVPSLGIVEYRYDLWADGRIELEVDFTGLNVDWTRAYLMNEQGAKRFTEYWDVTGRHLVADEIGIWERSGEFVAHACFSAPTRQLGFCVEPVAPAAVYFGRERYNQYNWRGIYYLSWSGVDIEIEAPQSVYRYQISLEAR